MSWLRSLGLLASVFVLVGSSGSTGKTKRALVGTRLGPALHLEPPTRVIYSNDSGVILDCAAHGIPSPQISWQTSEGTKVPIGQAGASGALRQVLAHNHSLYLPPFPAHSYRPEVHAAGYRCVAESPSGKVVSRTARLKAVLRADLDVHISATPVSTGNSALLRCRVASVAQDYVSVKEWHRNGQKIAGAGSSGAGGSTSRYLMLPGSGHLAVLHVSPQDSQHSFRCLVVNAITQEEVISPEFNMQILSSGVDSAPQLLLDPPRRGSSSSASLRWPYMALGRSVLIPCFTSGTPPPITSWFKEGPHHLLEPLPSNPRYVERGGGALWIQAATKEDLGAYRCVSRNSAGEKSYTVHLLQSAYPDHQSSGLGIPPPELELVPDLQVANLGAIAKFRCQVKPEDAAGQRLFAEASTSQQHHQLLWLKDGLPLSAFSSRLRVVGAGGDTIVISNVQAEDTGVYQCVFNAQDGTQTQAAAELRLGDAAPSLQYTFIDQTVQPGPLVSLKCSASGSPTPSIQWLLDGFPLPGSERFMIGQYVTVHNDVISHLNISQTHVADGGLYTCRATNRAGSSSHSARLNIYGPPEVRRFPSPLRAVEGKPYVVHCPAAGFPLQEVTWYKAHRLLTSGPNVKVYPNGTLVFFEVSKTRDEAHYSCKVKNRQGQRAEGSTQIKVIVSPQIHPFTVPAGLQAGDRLALTCTVFKGNLPLDISWTYPAVSGTPADAPAQVKPIRIDEFTSMLTIGALSPEHAGRYACVAANAAGQDTHSQLVTVNVPPLLVPFPAPAAASLRAGLRTRLLCSVSRGDLPVHFTWLRDGAEVGGHHQQHQLQQQQVSSLVDVASVDSFSSMLTIPSLTAAHSGNYTCRAANEAGQDSYTASITVRVPPSWVSKPKDLETIVHSRVELPCQAEGAPKPQVTWKKELASRPGEFLELFAVSSAYPTSAPSSTDEDWILASNGSLILRIATPRKSGRYLCHVSNGIGEELNQVVNFSVKAPPEILKQEQSASVVTTSVGVDRAVLECEARGDRPITVTWTKNGLNILSHNARGRYSMETLAVGDGGIKSLLSIKDINTQDESAYLCAMENPFGTDQAEIFLVVQEPPRPPESVQAVQIKSTSAHIAWKASSGGSSSAPSSPSSPSSGSQRLAAAKKSLPITNFVIELTPVNVPWGVSSSQLVNAGDGRLTWVAVTELQPHTEYKVRVSAENELGRGDSSQIIKFWTQGSQPTGRPRNLQVVSPSSTSLLLKWEDPDTSKWNGPIVAYKVGYKDISSSSVTVSSYNWTEVERHDTSDLQLHLRDLRPFRRYEILIQALNDFGAGPMEATSAKTKEDVPESSPTGIRCRSIGSTSLKVEWDPLNEADLRGRLLQYNLYYQDTEELNLHQKWNGGSVALLAKVPNVPGDTNGDMNSNSGTPPATSVLLEGLRASRNYSVLVSAVTSEGEGPLSKADTFCITDDDAPSPPNSLTVFPLMKSDGEAGVILVWNFDDNPPPRAAAAAAADHINGRRRANKGSFRGAVRHFTLYKRFRSSSSSLVETEPVTIPSSVKHYEVNGLQPGVYYQFWMTATNGYGEGKASHIQGHRVPQFTEAELRTRREDHPILLSLNQTLTFAVGASANLPCKQRASDLAVKRIWDKDGQELLHRPAGDRIWPSDDELLIQRLQLEDAGNYTCTFKSPRGQSEVTYRLIVQDVPEAPILEVKAINPDHFMVTVQSVLRSLSNPPTFACTVVFKQRYGVARTITVPGRSTFDAQGVQFRLGGLQCGRKYQLHAQCFNKLGTGATSRLVTQSTLGDKPKVPVEGFLQPSNNSVRLNLYKWNDETCPVSYFVVEYRIRTSSHWTLVSNNLLLTTRRFTIRQLQPETTYELRLRANNAAGSSEHTYGFETVPSGLQFSGEKLGAGSNLDALGGQNGGSDGEGSSAAVVLPVTIAVMITLGLVVVGVVLARKKALSRKGTYLHSEEHLTSSSHGGHSDSMMSKHFLHPLPPPTDEAIYAAPGEGPVMMDTMGKIPQKAEDIYPYATFVLPDDTGANLAGQPGTLMLHPSAAGTGTVTAAPPPSIGPAGTVRHMDMLVLHENSTLPLSDANSKSSTSNAYTSVHRPLRRRRKRKSRASLSQQHKISTLPKHVTEETDDESSEQAPSSRGEDDSSSLNHVEDFSHWDPSPKKRQGYNLEQMQMQKQKAAQQVNRNRRYGQRPQDCQETTSYSEEGDEVDNDYDDDSEAEAPNVEAVGTPLSEEEERIFIKQDNGQFIALKPSQVMFHAHHSHLAFSPKSSGQPPSSATRMQQTGPRNRARLHSKPKRTLQ